jgi:thiol-disulfide isomerase/thioredoxin
MKKAFFLTPLAVAFAAVGSLMFASSAHAETAQEIFKKFESQKAEALAAYLAANAAAADAAEAEALLIDAYSNAGDTDKAAALYQKRYDSLAKGAEADLQELIGGVIQPLFKLLVESGRKDDARTLLEKARSDLAGNPQAAQIGQFFDGLVGELSVPSVGDTMEIAFTATDGSEVDLAKMKDKVVLVDFWATWCAPCVAEMPHVIAAYEEFHDKGFEVIGISLDQDKSALEGFVKQRGMTWAQFFDGKGWENDMVRQFGIRGIPATFLIGKDGKVAASNLRGEELGAKVKQLLGE